MRNTILVSKVNFAVCAAFIFVFGLFMTNTVINLIHLDNPITNATASLMGINDTE